MTMILVTGIEIGGMIEDMASQETIAVDPPTIILTTLMLQLVPHQPTMLLVPLSAQVLKEDRAHLGPAPGLLAVTPLAVAPAPRLPSETSVLRLATSSLNVPSIRT